MKQKLLLTLAGVLVLALGGQFSSPIQRTSLQNEIFQLKQQGVEVRFLDNATVEVSDPVGGLKRVKTLEEPSEAEIRAWAASRGIPILEIDPTTIDTNLYAGRFRYWTQVPLSNTLGFPLVVDDFNHDRNPEVYGLYHFSNDFDAVARIYQVDSSGQPILMYEYPQYPGASIATSDIERNGRREVVWTYAYVLRFFEQSNLLALPTTLTTAYSMIVQNLGVGYTSPKIGFLDSDSSTDLLYYGTFPDSVDTSKAVSGLAVAEYDPTSRTLQRVWTQRNYDEIGELTIDDLNADGHNDFCCSFFRGVVKIFETVGDNVYQEVWQDSVPFVNFYYGTSGDVDNDGKPELFRGATIGTGNWTTVFEADSVHRYSARFLFHFVSGGTGDEPTYIATDIDDDGKLEFVLMSGRHVFMLKSFTNDRYTLWYYKREDTKEALTMFDLDGDGRKDIIISKRSPVDSLGRWRLYADMYLATNLLSVTHGPTKPTGFELHQNFPNPFNSETTISFEIPQSDRVRLTVSDLLGRVVETLLDEEQTTGKHQVKWNAGAFSSGVYLCRFQTSDVSLTRKLLLIR